MSFLSGQKKEIFFITKSFNSEIISQSDILLSPEFYWAKRITLNVNFTYEVKKMAPSLFEGILPTGKFEYLVLKLAKNDFIVIAFDISHIKRELKLLDINIDLIDKIYILESELLGIDVASKVDDDFGIISSNGVLVYTPLKFFEPNSNIEKVIKDKKLSKNHIYSKQFRNVKIEPKQLTLLLWIVFLLNSIIILDVIKTEKKIEALISQKEDFIKKNKLPQTSFQIKSMQTELQVIDKTQSDLRESIYYVSKFKLKKDEFFERINYTKNKLDYSVKL